MAAVNRLNKMCQGRDGKVSVNTAFFFLIQNGRTLLYYAAQEGHSEVLTKLLDSGADVGVHNKVRKFFSYEIKYISCIGTKSVSV